MHDLTRRDFLKSSAAASLAGLASPATAFAAEQGKPLNDKEPFFLTRGVVLVPEDIQSLDWPARAKRAGLTTIATHIFPSQIVTFVKTDAGQKFLEECRKLGLQVEHELHAVGELLPRALFDKEPALFRMNEKGERVRQSNLCVHSPRAVEIVCESAARYTELLRSTTGRYFYWPDDGQPMCRCPKCKELSDSDQTLFLENRMLEAIRRVNPRATLAHLVYATTLKPPTKIKPAQGVFLEFAPISRVYDKPLGQRDAQPGSRLGHGGLLDLLDANLEVFGREGAQALEYWLDLSRFSQWKRDKVQKLPWNQAVYADDLRTYAARGVRHVTSFAVWLDGQYVRRFGDPPLNEYGEGMTRWSLVEGKPA